MRERSIAITTPTATKAHQAASTSSSIQPASRSTASAADRDAHEHEEGRLRERGEVLGLEMAVEVRRVRRLAREADREERQQRRDEVGAAVRRLGDEGEAPRCEAGRELDRDQRHRRRRPRRGRCAAAGDIAIARRLFARYASGAPRRRATRIPAAISTPPATWSAVERLRRGAPPRRRPPRTAAGSSPASPAPARCDRASGTRARS